MADQGGGNLSRVFLVYSYIFAAFCLTMIVAMFFSFVLGGYTIYNTQLGVREAANSISLFPIFVFGAPVPVFSTVTLADIFSGLWALYIILFAIAINGPRRSVLEVIRRVREGGVFPFHDNTALTVAASFSILIVIFSIIERIQSQIGIPTGTLPESSPIRAFTMMSLAPIVEEVGFRATLIGGVAFLILLSHGKGLSALKAIWHPSRTFEEEPSIRSGEYRPAMYFVIVVSGLFFGAAHIAYESTWEIGKLSTATIAGLIIGWIYFKQGFPAAILLHWSFNFLTGAYVYFACALTVAADACEEAVQTNPLVNYFELLVVTTGILAVGMILLNRRMGRQEK